MKKQKTFDKNREFFIFGFYIYFLHMPEKTTPTLTIWNSSGKNEKWFPVSIDNTPQPVSNEWIVSLKNFINKKITAIEVNGTKHTLSPAIIVQENTRLRFQYLTSRNPSCDFTDLTNSDNTLLIHPELSQAS